MHCIKNITDDLIWVGANDRRLALFEGVYSVPYGVSYNSYLLKDEKTALFDTVDKAVTHRFLENAAEALGGRTLDYLIVQHMEPDHSSVIAELAAKFPEMRIVCNAKTRDFMMQFFDFDVDSRVFIVAEGDKLETGRHVLNFVMAPMVHWPEVMVTYDSVSKTLFSADAFGCFGALNGAIFSDEVDFEKDYMDEARRYYTNIVGKYGTQVQSVLEKAGALEIDRICPLHGFVWRRNIGGIVAKYALWSGYVPEESGVMIAYASVYGNTENAAEILACRLREKGIKTAMYDVSVTSSSEVVSAAFRLSHLVFASTTYNAGIFIKMEELINDLTAHNIQNRSVAIIENGSWAAASGGLIRKKLETCKNISFIGDIISIRSALKAEQLSQITELAELISATFKKPEFPPPFNNLSYGLFVLTTRLGGKDDGCIINTAMQITSSPERIAVTVNKANYTHDIIAETGEFNVSVLTENAPFGVFKQFGFSSGRDTDKFIGESENRSANGIRYISEYANSVISGKVVQSIDCGTHTQFIADVTESFTLSDEPSATYKYYFEHIKPKPPVSHEHKKGFVCKVCGFVYEGEELPDGYVCPLCKHGADVFEAL